MRTLLILVWLAAAVWAQNVPGAPPKTEPKTKKVWTEDEIKELNGPVNVVGKPAPATRPSTSKGKPNSPDVPEQEACVSAAWASGVRTILSAQGVQFGPKFWPMKLFNDLCLTEMKPAELPGRISGDYVMDDATTKVHIDATLLDRQLPAPSDIVNAARLQRPFMISWKKHPYIVTNVEYLEHYHNEVISDYSIKKIYLADPIDGRTMIFDATLHRTEDIEGSLLVTVTVKR